MKPWVKAVACIALVLMVGFTTVGYAALTDTLNITGSAKIEIPYGLFITSIKTQGSNNADKNVCSYLDYSTTVKSEISRGKTGAGSVTYTITVFNNTDLTYSYRKLYYQTNLSEYNGNSYITESTTNADRKISVVCSLANAPAESKIVKPGQSLTFTVTYTLGKNMDHNTNWNTLINYQFGINVDGEAQALEIIENKFLDILNNQVTYNQLIDALDNKYDGSQEWTSNYIGNVKGSTSNDSVAVNTLFAGHLQITVGNKQQDATVLIKHENLDGNNQTGDDYVAQPPNNNGRPFYGYGCEMTLYLTIDPLTASGQYVPVYVVVFTRNRDENGNFVGDWYRIGDTYAGEADVVTYEGGTGGGSFCTDRWRANSTSYTVVEGYSYTVGGTNYRLNRYTYQTAYREGIKSIVTTKDANAISTTQTLLDHAYAIINSQNYAGTGIELVEQAYAAASRYYTLDANGKPVVISGMTRAQLCPVMKDLRYAVDTALKQMEALEKEQNG